MTLSLCSRAIKLLQSITQTTGYYKLNATHLASMQTGQPLDHPFKDRVTFRWKSYAQ